MNNFKDMLSKTMDVSKREMDLMDATYDYAFKMWVTKWGMYVIWDNIAEEVLKIHKSEDK